MAATDKGSFSGAASEPRFGMIFVGEHALVAVAVRAL